MQMSGGVRLNLFLTCCWEQLWKDQNERLAVKHFEWKPSISESLTKQAPETAGYG